MAKVRGIKHPQRGIFEKTPGSGVWWIRYADGVGAYKREKVGNWSAAKALYEKRKTDARLGVKMPENLRHRGITFGALADAALEYSKNHHKDTRNVAQRIRHLRDAFGNRTADGLKPAELDSWLSEKTAVPATANRYRATISLIYREAIRNGKASSNPARLVRQRPENNARTRFLKPEEELRLRNAVTKLFPEHLPELTISLKTGMRRSEQYGLRWGQVDFDRKEIQLRDTKNKTARNIPMTAHVELAFRERWKAKVCHGDIDPVFGITEPRKWFTAALIEAKISEYRWHDNRHTFCSRLAENGASVFTIMKLAGHKTISMSARYTHMSDKTLASAIALLD